MFLTEVVFVITVIFWGSLLISEILCRSEDERSLAPSVRVGLGYVFLLAYFAAAWRFVSPQWSWLLGLLLLATFLAGQPRPQLQVLRAHLQRSLRGWLVAYVQVLLAANLLLAPLHVAGTYGPFTEGGGDVTIYADVAKYVVEHDMSVWGVRDIWLDIHDLLTNPITDPDPNVSSSNFEPSKGNPPAADFAAYLITLRRFYPSTMFSPIGQWFMLSGHTNYSVFFAVSAFEYAVLCLAILNFARRYDSLAAFLALFIVIASHGLASVFYNLYFLQATALMLCAILLAALPAIRLTSVAGLRSYGLSFAILFSTYPHYLTVAGPLLLARSGELLTYVRLVGASSGLRSLMMQRPWQAPRPNGFPGPLAAIAGVLLGVLFTLWLAAESITIVRVVAALFARYVFRAHIDRASVEDIATYFGTILPVASPPWLTFFFGSLSQQHYPPFAITPDLVVGAANAASTLGLIALIGGGLLAIDACRHLLRRHTDFPAAHAEEFRRHASWFLGLYAAGWALFLFHHMIAQVTLYVQAKGAQNVLMVLYGVLMILPLAWSRQTQAQSPSRGRALLNAAYVACLIGFGAALLIPRIYFGMRLAYAEDRATVLESSYYAEAKRLRDADHEAFVLVEPKASSDVYFINQSFAGGRMIPTRYLLFPAWSAPVADRQFPMTGAPWIAADFFTASDVPHLWLLHAQLDRVVESALFGQRRVYSWHATSLAQVSEPLLLLTGEHYTRFLRQEPRSGATSDPGWFSYLRNGAVTLVRPAGSPAERVTLTVRPVSVDAFDSLAEAARIWLQQGVITAVEGARANGSFVLEYDLPATKDASLAPLFRFGGEFYANVRINGAELAEIRSATMPVPEVDHFSQQLAFAWRRLDGIVSQWDTSRPRVMVGSNDAVTAGQTITVAWDRVEDSSPDDWIGLFPAGGNDTDRLTFVPTGGGSSGSVALAIPAAAVAGDYELRLFTRGTWQRLATSPQFALHSGSRP